MHYTMWDGCKLIYKQKNDAGADVEALVFALVHFTKKRALHFFSQNSSF